MLLPETMPYDDKLELMTSFYICRHGETENNAKRVLSGWLDSPLTEQGKKDAVTAAHNLQGIKIDTIVSSDTGRAVATARIIAKELGRNDTIESYEGLRDVNYGDLAGKPYTGPDSVYPDIEPEENALFVPLNGESLAQMQRRVVACIIKIGDANPDKAVLLVAHDGTMNAIQATCDDKNIGIIDANSNNVHGGVAKFFYDKGRILKYEKV
jgi:broad specificity phosphatase PhoE